MKFQSYQNQAMLGAPNIGTTNFRVNDPGALAATKEAGQTGIIMAQGAMQYIDKVNTSKAMEANEYYNKRMTEESADLINNHKEGEALNITELYDKRQQQVMDETRKRYGNYINYGKGAETFHEFTTKDNTARRNNMVQYQAVETEKNEATRYGNQVNKTAQDAAIGNYSDDSMAASFNRLDALSAVRFGMYGQERIESEARKAKSALVVNALDYYVTNKDWNKGLQTIDQYKDYLPPEYRTKFTEICNTKLKERANKEKWEGLYEQYKDDPKGFQAALQGIGNDGVLNIDKTMARSDEISAQKLPYRLSGNGSDSYDCGLYTQDVYDAGGYHFESRCADRQYYQMEQEGRLFTDTSQLQPGDIVFYDVPNSRWAYSDDPNCDDSHAYMGVSHVGVYVGDGKVRQYGNSGLSDMPLDTYKVVGCGKLVGTSTPMSSEDVEEGMQYYWRRKQEDKRIEAVEIETMSDNYAKQLQGGATYWNLKDGVTSPKELKALNAAAASLGISTRAPSYGRGLGGGTVSANGIYRLSDKDKSTIVESIGSGEIGSAADVFDMFSGEGLALNSTDSEWIKRQFRDAADGKGNFSYDAKAAAEAIIKEQFPELKGERKTLWTNGIAKLYQLECLVNMSKNKTDEPNASEVKDAVISKIKAGPMVFNDYVPESNLFMSEKLTVPMPELYGAGYDSIVTTGENEYQVHNYRDGKWYWMSGQDIDRDIKKVGTK